MQLFLGQVTGTAAGSKVFTQYGWRADAALNVGLTVLTLFIHLARGPHVSRYTWVGWSSGWAPAGRQCSLPVHVWSMADVLYVPLVADNVLYDSDRICVHLAHATVSTILE